VCFTLLHLVTVRTIDLLRVLGKISENHVLLYTSHYNKLALAFKGNQLSIEGYLGNVYRNYRDDSLRAGKNLAAGGSKGGKKFNSQKNGDTVAKSKNKWTWVRRGALLIMIFLPLLGTQLYVINKINSGLKSDLDYINRFPVVGSEIYAGETYASMMTSQRVLELESNATPEPPKYSQELLQTFTQTKENFAAIVRSGKNIHDSKYESQVKSLVESNLCETLFGQSAQSKACLEIVSGYLKNGFWSLAP
jgi:hypothetical protein